MILEVHVNFNKRFYIIHPKLHNSHEYLPYFMDAEPLLYVRLESEALSLADVQQQIETACREQIGSGSLADVAMLILDEGDRAVRSALEIIPKWLLFERGVERLTLLSRDVPRTLFADAELRDEIQLLPVDESLMLYDYQSLPERDSHLVEVNTFGEGQVYVNGERVKLESVGILPRNLLFYFIDRPITRRDEVFRLFWPTLGEVEATNVFHVTKRKVHDLVGIPLTEYHSGFYRVAPGLDVRYDVDILRRLVQVAQMPDDEPNLKTLENALSLCQNDFLTSLNGVSWVTERRDELKELRVDICTDLGRRYLRAENLQAALSMFLLAYQDNMSREDIIAHVMRLYLHTGQSCAAWDIYKRTRDRFLIHLDLHPGKILRDLGEQAQAACAEKDS